MRLVYSSNLIESAGNSLGVTINLFRAVFRGDEVPIDIEERDPEYKAHLEHLSAGPASSDGPPARGPVTARNCAACTSAYMKEMVQNLNHDIEEAEKSSDLDPYTLAARYHHQFVNTHPFGDGNGRMSRTILNTILLRYAGHVTEIGLDDDERDKYLRIATRASKTFHAEDMEVEFHRHTGHLELAKFVFRGSRKSLQRSRPGHQVQYLCGGMGLGGRYNAYSWGTLSWQPWVILFPTVDIYLIVYSGYLIKSDYR